MASLSAAHYRERILQNFEFHEDSCEFYQNADPDESYEESCDCNLIELVVDLDMAARREASAATERHVLEKIEKDLGITIKRSTV